MDAWGVAYAAFIAFGFVAWGLVGNRIGLTGPWLATLVYMSATCTILSLNFRSLSKTESLPGIVLALIIILAGFFNGLSSKLYGDKMSSQTVDPALFTVMVFAFMVAETPVLNLILNGKIPTLNNLAGFVLAIGAIYFLNK
jgi:hypothetical protein